MQFNIMFYKDPILKSDTHLKNKVNLNDLFTYYQVNKQPIDINIDKRNKNYFDHNLEHLMNEYKKQIPYLKDGIVVKTSSKTNSGTKPLAKDTVLYEKDLCKELWYLSHQDQNAFPLEFIDLQIPLKNSQGNNYGEIDLVAVDIKDGNIMIYLVEAKPFSTTETLTRAVIEIITYYYMIKENEENFIKDFKNYIMSYQSNSICIKEINKLLENNSSIIIKPVVLVPEKLYKSEISQTIYENYQNEIDFYTLYYDSSFVEYGEFGTKSLLFTRKNPVIEKYIKK